MNEIPKGSARRRTAIVLVIAVVAAAGFASCASTPKRPPIRTEAQVDLQRFMGDWYVIANIPTFIEKGAHNAIESYRLDEDGTIATTFTFRKDSFDGEPKVHTPRGFVRDSSNALWGMRFVWPIKAEYRIVYVDPEYQYTVIGRTKRDYVWIMARQPTIPDAQYEQLVALVREQGYDIGKLQKVPQRWNSTS